MYSKYIKPKQGPSQVHYYITIFVFIYRLNLYQVVVVVFLGFFLVFVLFFFGGGGWGGGGLGGGGCSIIFWGCWGDGGPIVQT